VQIRVSCFQVSLSKVSTKHEPGSFAKQKKIPHKLQILPRYMHDNYSPYDCPAQLFPETLSSSCGYCDYSNIVWHMNIAVHWQTAHPNLTSTSTLMELQLLHTTLLQLFLLLCVALDFHVL
jgi:hypothetical protein